MSRYKDAIYWMANHGGFDTSRSLERRLADLAASQVVRMTSDLYVRPVTVVVQDVLRQQDQQAGKSTMASGPTGTALKPTAINEAVGAA